MSLIKWESSAEYYEIKVKNIFYKKRNKKFFEYKISMEGIMALYTRKVRVGNLEIGGKTDVVIQSMTNTDTRDVEATVKQIKELEAEGCELVRVSVLDIEAAKAIKEIKKRVMIPVAADIHFDYKLALESIKSGVDKLRINPGNIGSDENIKKVADAAKANGIPIRIGVNGGSLEKHILEKYGHVTSEAMCESALYHVALLEKFGFEDIIISLKSSNVKIMYDAYMAISKKVNYPLHLGVTEAGSFFQGTVKSSIGIGALLLNNIGDTIRVSLTENPVEEIKVAKQILRVAGIRNEGVEIISCPTCGRTQIDLINLAKTVEKEFGNIKKPIKIAVMGCVVNGPGEAREADLGVAGGNGVGLIFKKGEIIKKVEEKEIINELKKIINEEFS